MVYTVMLSTSAAHRLASNSVMSSGRSFTLSMNRSILLRRIMMLKIETRNGVKELMADSIVSAIGFVPDQTLADKSNPHVHVIGDANFVSNLKGAVWYANDLAIALSK